MTSIQTKFMSFWFSSKKSNITAIQRFDLSKKNLEKKEYLMEKLKEIDKEILNVSKAFLEANKVQLQSKLSRRSGWLSELKKDFYFSAAKESSKWHREQLILLNKERATIQTLIEKEDGSYVYKQIQRLITILVLTLTGIIALAIFILGTIAALYILPLALILLLAYLFLNEQFKLNK